MDLIYHDLPIEHGDFPYSYVSHNQRIWPISHSKTSMFEVLELPSTSGANRNHVDRYGSTPLMEALGQNR